MLRRHDGGDGKRLNGQPAFGKPVLHGADDLEFAELLPGQTGKVCPFIEERQERYLSLEAIAAHDVMDVIAIKSGRRREQDEVVPAGLQFMGLQHRGIGTIDLLLGNELVVVVHVVEHPAARTIAQRYGHASFAGRQTVVAQGRLAVVLFQPRQIDAHRAAHPHGQ